MASVRMTTARSEASDVDTIAHELVEGLGGPPKFALLFVPSSRDQVAIHRAVRARLPVETRLLGASCAAGLDNGGLHGGITLAGLHGDFEVGLGLGLGLSRDAVEAGTVAMARACAELGTTPAALDTTRCFGIVLDDASRDKKEEFLIGMLAENPDLVLVGGGASTQGPDPTQQPAFVHLDGAVEADAVVLAVFRTSARWAVMRSHWYEPTGTILHVTSIDASCKRALEIDGRPAAQRYAEILGVDVEELEFGKPHGFSEYSTGIKIGREYFMRSPWKPLPDGSILFANLLVQGMELELMRRVDMAASIRNFFTDELPRRLPEPSCALLFQCGGCIWTAAARGVLDEVSAAFHAAPTAAGLQVSFEIYCGLVVNTTLTVLAFGDSP